MGRRFRLLAAIAGVGVLALAGSGPFSALLQQQAEAASNLRDISPERRQRALSSFGRVSSTEPSITRTVAKQNVQPLSAEDYLALLATLESPEREHARGQSDISTTQAGPATLALSRFFPSRGSSEAQFWIEATLADVPNIALLRKAFARIEIERVQRVDGVNIHAHDSRFETEYFETLALDPTGTSGLHTSVRSVRVAGTAKRDDIAYVTGRLSLKLPIETKAISLDKESIGVPQLSASGASVQLLALGGSEVAFRTTGRPEAYVTVIGYDSAGQRLASAGESVSANGAIADRKALFHGKLEWIEVVFASGYLTKTFPFVLKGPGARRRQSIGPQPKPAAGPLIVELRAPQAASALPS